MAEGPHFPILNAEVQRQSSPRADLTEWALMRLNSRETAAASPVLPRQENQGEDVTMLPYTATDMIAAMTREYGLDDAPPSAQHRTAQQDPAAPRRRLATWAHSLLTALL